MLELFIVIIVTAFSLLISSLSDQIWDKKNNPHKYTKQGK